MPLDEDDRLDEELALEEEKDDFVDATALARAPSSFPSSSMAASIATTSTTVATVATVATAQPQQQPQQQQQQRQRQQRFRPLLRGLKLGLASSYYSMAEVLRLRRLGEIVKVIF